MADEYSFKEALMRLAGEEIEPVFGEIILYRFVADAVEQKYLSSDVSPEMDEQEYLNEMSEGEILEATLDYLELVFNQVELPINNREWEHLDKLFRTTYVGLSTEGEEAEWRKILHDFFDDRDSNRPESLHICTDDENNKIQHAAETLEENAHIARVAIADSIEIDPSRRDSSDSRSQQEDVDLADELMRLIQLAVYGGPVAKRESLSQWINRAETRILTEVQNV